MRQPGPVALLLAVGAVALAADAPRLVELVKPRHRLQAPVLYLVDTSCSMGGTGPAAETLAEALSGLDAGTAGLVAWGSQARQLLWGREGQRRWLDLPDAQGAERGARWLAQQPLAPSTELAPALALALADPEVRSVVLISDGLLDDAAASLALVRRLRERRVVLAGLLVRSSGAAVGSASGPGLEVMRALAVEGGGGLWERQR